jgi:serine/threonine protein kinase
MLGDEIGKGAYGRVYKGLDLENGDFVAIKQVSLENIPQEDLNIIMVRTNLFRCSSCDVVYSMCRLPNRKFTRNAVIIRI